ncbi:MAG: hypothetical protein ACREFX_03305, partial [Opitutaceae bacterium]
ANVVLTTIPGATLRLTQDVETVTWAPAAAMLCTWRHAVMQILAAPSFHGKLYSTRSGRSSLVV